VDIYESLRQVLDAHPSTAPQAESIHEILKILFTPEEAALAATMSFKVRPGSEIAIKAGLDEETVLMHLEAMADKGIIISRNKDGEIHYGLVPLIPGVFEFPFMKSSLTPLHQRLGELWEDYHREALGAAFAGNPTPLMSYIEAVESALGITAEKQFLPMQPGDVPATAADTAALEAWTGFKPNTPVKEGVARFVAWYREFYGG